MKRYAYTLIALLAVISCAPQLPDSPEMLVIEGWIENDAAPVVFVTSSVSTSFDEKNMSDLLEHLALTAQVTVTHNGKKYNLMPTISMEYLLGYCYTTTQLKGEIGGTYHLDVSWRGMHAEAVTSILPPGHIDSMRVEHHPTIDSLYLLKAHIVPAPDVRYYRFFSMASGKDLTYTPSYVGTFDIELNKDEMIAVNRGHNNPIIKNDYYYAMGDCVKFKLASMENDAYEFWSKYEENLMFSHIALIPYSNNLKANIVGGLGYWFGYGVTKYELKIEN